MFVHLVQFLFYLLVKCSSIANLHDIKYLSYYDMILCLLGLCLVKLAGNAGNADGKRKVYIKQCLRL